MHGGINIKIGLVFGCFDLFHVGHLNALKTAAKYCDMLFIGVFSDRVIQSYKASPIIPEKDRLEIIRYINLDSSCKSHVMLVDYRNPINWLTDYFFVSEQLLSKPLAMLNKKVYRGQIIYLPYTKNISTSWIKTKIRLGGCL